MDYQEQEEALFNTCKALLTCDAAINDAFIPVIIIVEKHQSVQQKYSDSYDTRNSVLKLVQRKC
jgi:hypothetical protein